MWRWWKVTVVTDSHASVFSTTASDYLGLWSLGPQAMESRVGTKHHMITAQGELGHKISYCYYTLQSQSIPHPTCPFYYFENLTSFPFLIFSLSLFPTFAFSLNSNFIIQGFNYREGESPEKIDN